jgi:hypothetical protein
MHDEAYRESVRDAVREAIETVRKNPSHDPPEARETEAPEGNKETP